MNITTAEFIAGLIFILNRSIGETRYVIIGMSGLEQLLVVAHTDRGNRIRVISARRATRQERKFYEEGS